MLPWVHTATTSHGRQMEVKVLHVGLRRTYTADHMGMRHFMHHHQESDENFTFLYQLAGRSLRRFAVTVQHSGFTLHGLFLCS